MCTSCTAFISCTAIVSSDLCWHCCTSSGARISNTVCQCGKYTLTPTIWLPLFWLTVRTAYLSAFQQQACVRIHGHCLCPGQLEQRAVKVLHAGKEAAKARVHAPRGCVWRVVLVHVPALQWGRAAGVLAGQQRSPEASSSCAQSDRNCDLCASERMNAQPSPALQLCCKDACCPAAP